MKPSLLLEKEEIVFKEVEKYLNTFKNYPYIFNLGHGILPQTNPKIITKIIEKNKKYKKMKADHPQINFGKTGVLLINLGTPDSTNWWDIRKYLKEFLSDRRVIEVNPILWQIILNLIILNLRPSKTAKAYKEIWMKKENMSPLRYFTIMQTKKLLDKITNKDIIIDYAMRYMQSQY